MAPNLQGLNLLLQPSQSSQDLLSEHPYPDLASLWTSINFDSEESPVLENNYPPSQKDEEEAERIKSAKNAAIHDGHVNVVTGTAIPNVQPSHQLPPNFDLSALLSGEYSQMFQQQQQQPQQAISPSLAQLLMFNAQNHISAPPSTPKERDDDQDQEPPAKRARTRKSSVSLSVSSPFEIDPQLSPTEDKRRRNTAASARFRMKKKEREAALEGKAKELETRVSELERECEGLRRENGWLKGLVVGVTGAAQGANATAATTTAGKRPRELEA